MFMNGLLVTNIFGVLVNAADASDNILNGRIDVGSPDGWSEEYGIASHALFTDRIPPSGNENAEAWYYARLVHELMQTLGSDVKQEIAADPKQQKILRQLE